MERRPQRREAQPFNRRQAREIVSQILAGAQSLGDIRYTTWNLSFGLVTVRCDNGEIDRKPQAVVETLAA
jgi:hypothetical protein